MTGKLICNGIGTMRYQFAGNYADENENWIIRIRCLDDCITTSARNQILVPVKVFLRNRLEVQEFVEKNKRSPGIIELKRNMEVSEHHGEQLFVRVSTQNIIGKTVSKMGYYEFQEKDIIDKFIDKTTGINCILFRNSSGKVIYGKCIISGCECSGVLAADLGFEMGIYPESLFNTLTDNIKCGSVYRENQFFNDVMQLCPSLNKDLRKKERMTQAVCLNKTNTDKGFTGKRF